MKNNIVVPEITASKGPKYHITCRHTKSGIKPWYEGVNAVLALLY